MITDLILADHRAGREIFAVAGNSPQQSNEERIAEFSRFADIWSAHNAMMDEIVLPAIEAAEAGRSLTEAARRRQRTVSELIEDVAERAATGACHDIWAADFERLKIAFESQCQGEATWLVPVILSRLVPDRIESLSRDAHALRSRLGQ